MNTAQTQRKSWISTARVIGILLVVLGHSYPFDVSIPTMLNQLRDFIYTFHMPLFIIISGYLSVLSNRRPAEYIAVRAKKLLIPYFVLSLAAFIPKMLVQQYLNDSVEFSLVWLIRSELVPRENIWGHFWFIPMIFFFGVFFAFFVKQLKQHKWVLLLALAASYMLRWLPKTTAWLALEDIRQNLFFYILGIAIALYGDSDEIVKNKLWLLGLPIALALFFLTGEQTTFGAVLMVGFVFCVGTMMDFRRNLFCQQIERYSFTIFLLSWPAQAVMEVLLNKMLHLPACVTMLCMFIAGIAVPLICGKAVEWMGRWIPVRALKTSLGM